MGHVNHGYVEEPESNKHRTNPIKQRRFLAVNLDTLYQPLIIINQDQPLVIILTWIN